METDKTKQQKDLERFFIAPNYTAVLGLTVTKETDIEDETEVKDEISSKVVKQTIKGLIFTIEEEMETVLQAGEKMKSYAKREIKLNEGTRLIWLEGKGYILPSEKFQTMAEIRADVECLKDL